ncbi:hypothetical protein EK904_015133 [Melospiza melodia maxima]|nr:hypothetical protein EK904_015133 [Melospiza melodia maxima]
MGSRAHWNVLALTAGGVGVCKQWKYISKMQPPWREGGFAFLCVQNHRAELVIVFEDHSELEEGSSPYPLPFLSQEQQGGQASHQLCSRGHQKVHPDMG